MSQVRQLTSEPTKVRRLQQIDLEKPSQVEWSISTSNFNSSLAQTAVILLKISRPRNCFTISERLAAFEMPHEVEYLAIPLFHTRRLGSP